MVGSTGDFVLNVWASGVVSSVRVGLVEGQDVDGAIVVSAAYLRLVAIGWRNKCGLVMRWVTL